MRHRKALMRVAAAAMAVGISAGTAFGQGEPVNGMREARMRAHAIVGATVVTQPGTTIENAIILIRDGVIQAVGPNLAVPGDARVWNAEGMTIYPGLIEPALLIESGDLPEGSGVHWNARVRPQINMDDQPPPDEDTRTALRAIGVTAMAVYPSNGAFAGSGVIIANAGSGADLTAYKDRADMMMRFETGGFRSGGGYPGSLMGAIALVRQTLMDAQWYQKCRGIYNSDPTGQEPPMHSDALSAMADVLNRNQRVLFEASDELNAMRAATIADEFNINMMLLGSGMEFRRLQEVADLQMPILVPVNYPSRPDIDSVDAADRLSLRDLQTWEQAPTNARRLHDAGVAFAFTTNELNNRNEYFTAIRSAVRHGLDEDAALAAVTTMPATLYGLDRIMGTIAPGKVANLVVAEGKLFDKDTTIRDTWVDGVRYEINAKEEPKLAGKGVMHIHPTAQVEAGDYPIDFNFQSNRINVSDSAGDDSKAFRARTVSSEADQMSFVVEATPFGAGMGYSRFTGTISGDEILGQGVHPDGRQFRFTIKIEERTDPTAGGNGDDNSNGTARGGRGNRGARGGRGGRDAADAGGGGQDADASDADPITGNWSLVIEVEQAPQPIPLDVQLTRNEDGTVEGSGTIMGQPIEFERGTYNEVTGELELFFPGMSGEESTMNANVSGGSMTGTMSSSNFEANFSGSRAGAGGQSGGENAADSDYFTMPPDELPVPLGAYGLTEQPQPQSVLITNATIWTSGPDGIIQNGYLAVRDGKVEAVGSDAPPTGTFDVTINAQGKHVTPGLFDAHSHTGVSGGVNEMAQTNTAEVSIQSVIDPDDINWYRQLAGGLVAANQLHGSANPIGGQNSVVKLKWGGSANDFIVEDAIKGIKFALGENVTRTPGRYPDSRMGVETFIRDAFTAAQQYEKEWNKYLSLSNADKAKTYPPRRDIEMDTLVEILNGDRLVHCHSYRQDEILMLVRVADDFGFTIGTFQHVLEGYKVAEAIAEHGAGASTFSDWWAYKVEAFEAIPYNGALMADVGVLVSFNSDSSELARRMNTEASKAVRYGGAEPAEALGFITSNSAKQFRIDHRMGSLQPGKDADFVLWSGDPLSTMTRCEQTWIEGTKYFDIEVDKQLRKNADAERQRIMQKALAMQHGEVTADEEADE